MVRLKPTRTNLHADIQYLLRVRLVCSSFKEAVESLARLWIREYLVTRSKPLLCKFMSYAPILWGYNRTLPTTTDWSRGSEDPWNSDSEPWATELSGWLDLLETPVDMVRTCDLLVTEEESNVPTEATGRILAMLGFRGNKVAKMWVVIFRGMMVFKKRPNLSLRGVQSDYMRGMEKVSFELDC